MNKDVIIEFKKDLENMTYKYFMLIIKNEKTNYSEMIISRFEFFEDKLNYLLAAYDENMRLKNNADIRILDIYFKNDLDSLGNIFSKRIDDIEIR